MNFVQLLSMMSDFENGKRLEDTYVESLRPLKDLVSYSRGGKFDLAYDTTIRQLASVPAERVPKRKVVESGIMPTLVACLERDDWPELQTMAVWILTVVITGEADHAYLVLRLGALAHFIRLAQSPDVHVRDHTANAIFAVVAVSIDFRDCLLHFGFDKALIAGLHKSPSPAVVRTLDFLARGTPCAPLESVFRILPELTALLSHENQDIARYSCWGVASLSDMPECRPLLFTSDVMKQLACLMKTTATAALRKPAVRVVDGLTRGPMENYEIDSVVLEGFLHVLRDSNENDMDMLRDITFIVCDTCARTSEQVQSIITTGLWTTLRRDLSSSPDLGVRGNAVWCIAKCAVYGTDDHRNVFVGEGVVPLLCGGLAFQDARLTLQIMAALAMILGTEQKSRREHIAADQIIASGIEEQLSSATLPPELQHSRDILTKLLANKDLRLPFDLAMIAKVDQTTDYPLQLAAAMRKQK